MVPPGIPNTTLAPAASSDRTIDCAPVIDSPCPTPPRATSPGVTVAAWRCAVGSLVGGPAAGGAGCVSWTIVDSWGLWVVRIAVLGWHENTPRPVRGSRGERCLLYTSP